MGAHGREFLDCQFTFVSHVRQIKFRFDVEGSHFGCESGGLRFREVKKLIEKAEQHGRGVVGVLLYDPGLCRFLSLYAQVRFFFEGIKGVGVVRSFAMAGDDRKAGDADDVVMSEICRQLDFQS